MRSLTTLALLLCATLALPGCGCGGDEGLVAGLAPAAQPAPVIRAGGIAFGAGQILIPRVLGDRDPMGTPIAGVIVEIWKDEIMLGTILTNQAGEYIFGDNNVTGGLLPSTTYEMRVPFEGNQAIQFLQPLQPNQGADDQMDSDGDPSINEGFIVALFTTPADGDDFSIDFGFSNPQDEN